MLLGGENRSSLLGEKKTIPGANRVRHGFDLESVHVGFVVDKVALGKFLSKYLMLPFSVIAPVLYIRSLGYHRRYINLATDIVK
jgi:hypothetical protein